MTLRRIDIKRRRLDPSQLACVAVEIEKLFAVEAKERQLSTLKKGSDPVVTNLPQRDHTKSRDESAASVDGTIVTSTEAADSLHVSRKSVSEATSVISKRQSQAGGDKRTLVANLRQAIVDKAKSRDQAATINGISLHALRAVALGVGQKTVGDWFKSRFSGTAKARLHARLSVSAEDKTIIIEQIAEGVSQKQLAADFGISKGRVSQNAFSQFLPCSIIRRFKSEYFAALLAPFARAFADELR